MLRLRMHGVLPPIPHIHLCSAEEPFPLTSMYTTSICSLHTALHPVTHKYKLHMYSSENMRSHNILIWFITVLNSYKNFATFAGLLAFRIISLTSTFRLREQLVINSHKFLFFIHKLSLFTGDSLLCWESCLLFWRLFVRICNDRRGAYCFVCNDIQLVEKVKLLSFYSMKGQRSNLIMNVTLQLQFNRQSMRCTVSTI